LDNPPMGVRTNCVEALSLPKAGHPKPCSALPCCTAPSQLSPPRNDNSTVLHLPRTSLIHHFRAVGWHSGGKISTQRSDHDEPTPQLDTPPPRAVGALLP